MNTLQRRATIGSQSTASLNTVNSNTSTERKSLFTAEAHLLSLYSEEEPPTPTLLNQLLELALDCNGLKDTNRLPFYQFSTDKKLVFIKNMVRKLNERHEPTQDKSNSKEPKFYIEYLTSATIEISKQYNRTTAALHYVGSIARTLSTKTSTMLQQYSFPDIKSILAQLRAECSCQDASWLFSFVENGGLKALFGLLQVIQSKVDKYFSLI